MEIGVYRACLEVCPWEKLMAKAGLGIFSVVSTKVSAHPEGSSGAGVKPGYQVFAIHLDQSFDGSFCPGGSMTPGEVLLFIRGQFPEVVPPPPCSNQLGNRCLHPETGIWAASHGIREAVSCRIPT